MRQLRDRAGFAIEALAELRIGGERRGQDLDRDDAIEAGIARLVDFAHAAGADLRDDLVVAQTVSSGERHAVIICR